jgi:LuxR family transcriptional regulator, maltose regulon positive regulatory protein
MSLPSQASPSGNGVQVVPALRARRTRRGAVALRVVPSPASAATAGSSTLARLGAKTVLVGLGERRAVPFALVESKLAVPLSKAGTVSRTALVNRLRAISERTIVSIVAPAGYGKTTVCAQWARRDGRACAWLTVDERDNDPVVFIRHLAAALDRAVGIDPAVLDDLGNPGASVSSSALPRVAAALAAAPRPFLLILDDAHRIHANDAVLALELVAEHVPPGSTLALTGRRAPRLPVARLRAAGDLAEFDLPALRLTSRETALAVRGLGLDLGVEELAELQRRAEGWPAGVHLMALAMLSAGSDSHQARRPLPTGSHGFLADYFRSEVVSGLSEAELAFARRTSVLDRLSIPLCRAVLDGARVNGRRLEALANEGAFLMPLDPERSWFRYHPLIGEFLRHELEADEPELVPDLYRRAADWYEAHGYPEAAVGAAQSAGDVERVAVLVGSLAVPAYCAGKLATVGGWFDRLAEDGGFERHPAIAAVGAWVAAVRGRTAEAERLLAFAERGRKDALADGTPLRALVRLVRAALCAGGIDQMRADAEAAAAALPADSRLLPAAMALRAVALLFGGDRDAADAAFAEAGGAADRLRAPVIQSLALGERSLIAGDRGDHAAAEAFAEAARALVKQGGLEAYPTSGAERAASARAALRHGRWDEARTELTASAEVVPQLTGSLPWLAVQIRVELGRVYLALRDDAAARRMLAEAKEILARRPGLGALVADAAALEQELTELHRESNGAGSSLTGAELRLLPLLATHLSFREIGERLYVSRNTIKTQAISVYRKLGVSTRSAAIARAEHLGLVEASVAAAEITPSG